MLINGDFESDGGWITAPEATVQPQLSKQVVHSGEQAISLGLDSEERQLYSYSAVAQEVAVPADTQEAELSFWYYPSSTDEAGDVQYVLVQDEEGNETPLLRVRSGEETWQHASLSLAKYAGQTISVQFGVFNDGQAGITSMVVDDISLRVRVPTASGDETSSVQATPTPTPGEVAEESTADTPPLRDLALWTGGIALLFLVPLLLLAL